MTFSYLYSKFIKKIQGRSILRSIIERSAAVSVNCNIVECKLGKHSYIGHDSQAINVEIGAFCSISDHVFIGGAEHPINWVSTSPAFENVKGSLIRKRFVVFDVPKTKQTFIGSDVWIGHGATIKAGITIGHGAIVGAGSVVTTDVPPYAIVAGTPAKIVRYRFSDDIISQLLESEWWSLPDEKIQKIAEYIKEPVVFISKLKEL
ncbi:MAG: CatB-related O-acetyltransferase [Bacteroidales bacterium]|nr:CatB-related O-acetyltransferase [Bacteroidales bacterium]